MCFCCLKRSSVWREENSFWWKKPRYRNHKGKAKNPSCSATVLCFCEDKIDAAASQRFPSDGGKHLVLRITLRSWKMIYWLEPHEVRDWSQQSSMYTVIVGPKFDISSAVVSPARPYCGRRVAAQFGVLPNQSKTFWKIELFDVGKQSATFGSSIVDNNSWWIGEGTNKR